MCHFVLTDCLIKCEMVCALLNKKGYKHKYRLIVFIGIVFSFIGFYWYSTSDGAISKISFPLMKNDAVQNKPKAPTSIANPTTTNVKKDFIDSSLAAHIPFDVHVVDAESYPFNITSTDVVVYLHIQKTGGTAFGRYIVEDSDVDCKQHRRKMYKCSRPNDNTEWLFSRFTTGWYCGLHASLTSLSECVPSYFRDSVKNPTRRYFYFTYLREPVARYTSEYLHVRRGATWENAYLKCNGHQYDYEPCFDGPDWRKVPLEDFMNCKQNLATNRQTRMLANLHAINCTGKGFSVEEKDRIMLDTAKQNLKKMVFFGLVERQQESQVLFEKAFGIHFNIQLKVDPNTHVDVHAEHSEAETEDEIDAIKKLNHLDMKLYEYAKELFQKRYDAVT